MDTSVMWFFVGVSLIFCNLRIVYCLSDPGKWTFTLDERNHYVTVSKSLYKNSTIQIKVVCDDGSVGSRIKIGWVIRQAPCYEEYFTGNSVLMEDQNSVQYYYNCPSTAILMDAVYDAVRYLKSPEEEHECNHNIQLQTVNRAFEVKKTHDGPDRNCPNKPGEHFLKNNKFNPMFVDKDSSSEKLPTPSQLKNQKRPARALSDNQKATPASDKTVQKANPPGEKSTVPASETSITTTAINTENVNKSAKDETVFIRTNTMPNYEAMVDQDGLFLLIVYIDGKVEYNVTVNIEMKGSEGYLSAVDWPLLPFYGVMCAVYVIYAVIWLVISALQWRDLLRIQFWIGGVIFLGLVEKAVFYGEYQYINSTGQSIHGAILFAEILSCVKRTLARLLVIIVSLGFGIVKPRLGSVLHRIVGVGTLYLVLCVIEGCLRVLKPKNDPSNQTLMAGIPLAVLDSAICWWIFSSLVQTTRTLRLRRNVVKLTLYQHFTNTLIFAVLASIVYMSWSLYNHKLTNCITDWEELWVDEAYWHFLFSLVLMVIMILWRPTNNNQRYAFTPLLDAVDEEEDDYTASNDAFGMKSRGAKNQSNASSKNKEHRNSQTEDDLKWVEENIPSSFTDTALPSLLDSDEEIMTVRFERNKME